ncbi:MAG: hypothetical protein JWL77_346 [Chthonomonadaceae bacterium]|nr:hypothetical protein [Chthonomonadaceae bacterium]
MVEQRQWSGLPDAYTLSSGQRIPCNLASLIAQVAQAAGWSTASTPPLYHEFVVKKIEVTGGQVDLTAETETEIYSAEGDLFVGRLPVTLTFRENGGTYRIYSVIYDMPHNNIERSASWRRPLINTLNYLRRALSTDRASSIVAALERLASTQLPPVITVAVDYSGVSPYEQRILEWAVNQAIDHWNFTLKGYHRILWVKGNDYTDIVIQATSVPIAGGILGSYSDSVSSHASHRRTYKTIRVVTAASCGSYPLPRSPESLGRTVEHELGHAFGLADTDHPNCLMSGQVWNNPIPNSGSTEAAAVVRWHKLFIRYRHLACHQWNLSDVRSDVSSRVQEEVRNVGVVYRSTITRQSLLSTENWINKVWEGERLLRQGDWHKAIEAFEEATQDSCGGSQATLRKHMVAILHAPDPQPSIAFLESALCSGHAGWETTDPVHIERIIAYGYGRLGEHAADEFHMARAEFIAANRRILWVYQQAVEDRSPRRLLCAISHFLCVMKSGLRLARLQILRLCQ